MWDSVKAEIFINKLAIWGKKITVTRKNQTFYSS